MSRQQVSSAVGHLRHAGKIRETWEPVPGPPHGPKQVRQYEIMPQEDGLDAALIAALAASAAPDPDSPAGQAEASRLAAARVPQAERPIRRTSYTPPQALHHFIPSGTSTVTIGFLLALLVGGGDGAAFGGEFVFDWRVFVVHAAASM